MTYEEAMQSCIFRFLSGSHAYGFNQESSDEDYRGVFIAPLKCAFQLFSTKFVGQGTIEQLLKNASRLITEGDTYAAQECIRQAQQPDQGDLSFSVGTVKKTGSDEELQELRKFFKLAADCNPNIIEFLYIDDSDKTKEGKPLITHITPVWQRIRENRCLFLSKKARWTFSGYAIAQLKRIETHRGYLLNPKGKPSRKDFDLPEDSKISAEIQNAVLSIPLEFVNPGTRETVLREKKYKQQLSEYNAYRKWELERNPKRASLEAKCGYDCYAEDTEFLTDSGFKTFDNIDEQDCLATFNKSTFKVEYQRYIDKFFGNFSGNLYNLYGYHTDVSVTPNHRMFYRKVERKSCKTHDWQLGQVSTLPDTFEILRNITPNTKNYCEKEFFTGIDKFISKTDYLRLMGWYLSDGTMNFRDGRPRAIRVSQKLDGKLYKDMLNFYNKYKGKIKVGLYKYKRKPNELNPNEIIEVSLVVFERSLAQRLQIDCSNVENKHIPRWVFGLGVASLKILLNALMLGDGTTSRPDNSEIYYSKDRLLASNVQELAFLCGYETSLYGPYKNSNVLYKFLMYQVHINKTRVQFKRCVRSHNIKKVSAVNQKVVCFTTPNGTLITRHNGHIGLHGNSKHATHLIRLCRQAKEILQTNTLNVFRPDWEELLNIRNGNVAYEVILDEVNRMDQELDTLYNQSTLRDKPDHKRIDQLYQDICKEFYGLTF